MPTRFALLQTFVTVARLGSMKAAAEAMAITPGAISQRIRDLEGLSGERLFVRQRSGVTLSPAGARLFAALDEPFGVIESVARSLDPRAAGRVVVSTVGSFASTLLVPRLGEFTRDNPDVDVAVEIDSRVVDLHREPVDIAIRHGLGEDTGLESTWLVAPEMIVIASPGLLAAGPALKTAADCLRYPLIQDAARADWSLWFAAQGVDAPGADRGPAFAYDYLIVRAAVAGQGLGLVRDVYAEEDIRAGRLVQALDARWPSRFAYYAVAHPRALQRPAVRRFRDWLVAAIGSASPVLDPGQGVAGPTPRD